MTKIQHLAVVLGKASDQKTAQRQENAVKVSVLEALVGADALCSVSHYQRKEDFATNLRIAVPQCAASNGALLLLVVADVTSPSSKSPDVSVTLRSGEKVSLMDVLADVKALADSVPVVCLINSTYYRFIGARKALTKAHMADAARAASRPLPPTLVVWVRNTKNDTILIDADSSSDSDDDAASTTSSSGCSNSSGNSDGNAAANKVAPGSALCSAAFSAAGVLSVEGMTPTFRAISSHDATIEHWTTEPAPSITIGYMKEKRAAQAVPSAPPVTTSTEAPSRPVQETKHSDPAPESSSQPSTRAPSTAGGAAQQLNPNARSFSSLSPEALSFHGDARLPGSLQGAPPNPFAPPPGMPYAPPPASTAGSTASFPTTVAHSLSAPSTVPQMMLPHPHSETVELTSRPPPKQTHLPPGGPFLGPFGVPPGPMPAGPPPPANAAVRGPNVHFCEVCNCHVHGENNWLLHLSSEKHRRKALLSKQSATLDPEQAAALVNPQNFFKCDLCNVMISGEANYKQHLQGKEHQKNLLRQQSTAAKAANPVLPAVAHCSECKMDFDSDAQLQDHIQEKHLAPLSDLGFQFVVDMDD